MIKSSSLKSIAPIILANSSPFLFNKIDVGNPLRENFFGRLIFLSKKISRFSIFSFLKKLIEFEIGSCPTFIGIIFIVLSKHLGVN